MNNQNNSASSQNKTLINRIFYFSFILILVIAVAFTLISIFQPFTKKKISQLPKVTTETVLAKTGNSDSKYYVLVYDKNDVDNEIINKVVIEYFYKAKDDNKLLPIFVMDYNKQEASKVKELLDDIDDVSALPYMFIVEKGEIKTKYKYSSEINNTLITAMNK